MSPPFRLGLTLGLVVLLLDQATKELVLAAFETGARVEVLPVFNLVLVWNPGVSFGMLNGLGDAGRWLLTGLALAIAACLLVWLRRAESRGTATALGLVLGGAVGNVVDRLRHGAVVDFLDFHLAGVHWPAFNLADSAICAGAALLLLDGLRRPRARTS